MENFKILSNQTVAFQIKITMFFLSDWYYHPELHLLIIDPFMVTAVLMFFLQGKMT